MKLLVVCLIFAFSRADEPPNLVDLATSLEANKFVEYVKDAELEETFKGEGNYTIFVPTDAAFEALDQATKTKLADKTQLREILNYHVINKIIKSDDLENDALVDSMTTDKKKIRTNVFTVGDTKVYTATGSKVTKANNEALNGLIHVVDKVMLAPDKTAASYVQSTATLSQLLDCINKADLATVLGGDGPFTVFAPNDDAFGLINADNLTAIKADKPLLTTLIKNHVTNGTFYKVALSDKQEFTALGGNTIKVKIDGANIMFNEGKMVQSDDVLLTNGNLFVIDKVLQEEVKPEPKPSGGSALDSACVAMSLASLLALFFMRN